MLYIGEKVGMAHAMRGTPPARSRRSISRSIRSRGRTCARRERRTRLRCSRRRTAAGCCTRRTCTWRSSSSVRARRTTSSLDAPVQDNLKAIARCLGRDGRDLVVDRARTSAPRAADRRYPRDRRADPADRRRRSVGRHRGGGRRVGRSRGDGHGRRAGGRADRGGDAVPQRRDLRAARGQQARARGAMPRHGHHRLQEDLSLEGSRSGRESFSRPPASPTAR